MLLVNSQIDEKSLRQFPRRLFLTQTAHFPNDRQFSRAGVHLRFVDEEQI
jgi:hypothetical protein